MKHPIYFSFVSHEISPYQVNIPQNVSLVLGYFAKVLSELSTADKDSMTHYYITM